jgi:hypothetical protein
MKLILFGFLFLLLASNSVAQTSDTVINIRRQGTTYYYIDGIKVQSGDSIPRENSLEEVTVITGGLPVNYGDPYCGCIFRINCPSKNSIKASDKEQKMATE